MLQIAVPSEYPHGVPQLPAEYGYKGGAARAMLQYSLGLEVDQPRDLDIVFVGEEENGALSAKLAQEHMSEDYAHGYGVEQLESDYFTSRDFTLNEVLFDGTDIVCTRECLTDSLRNIVRFSDFEKQESYSGEAFFVKSKLIAKAARLVACAQREGARRARMADELEGLSALEVWDFDLALHLERALQQGPETAQRYLDVLAQQGFVAEGLSVQEALDYFSETTDFVFRSDLISAFREEQEMIASTTDQEIGEHYEGHTRTSTVPFWAS